MMSRPREIASVLLLAACCAALWFVPPPRPLAAQEGTATRARVVSVDDSLLETHGYLRFGTQRLDVDGVVKKILTTDYVQEELKGIRHN